MTDSRCWKRIASLLVGAIPYVLMAVGTAGCASPPATAASLSDDVRALDGHALTPPAIPADRRAELEANSADAFLAWSNDPDSEDAIIWLGRRLAYEGKYRLAMQMFSTGLQVHPDSYRLLRHRGHRHITCREFDKAVTDLDRASRLAWDAPDQVEQDGQPNEAGIPRSSTQTNIAYLGLAHYLLGDFRAARASYERGLTFGDNDDNLVSTSWWLYLTLRRLGDDAAAAEVLAPIREEMDILENHAYQRLLLMARGELDPEQLLPAEIDSIQGSTLGYGIAAFHLVEGRRERAQELFQVIVQGPWWPAFGHIAAEAELWRGAQR
jgi:tetratricopeptide (TPR) repeat protein